MVTQRREGLAQLGGGPDMEAEILALNAVYGGDDKMAAEWFALCRGKRAAIAAESQARVIAAERHGRFLPMGSREEAEINHRIEAVRAIDLQIEEFRHRHHWPS